MTQTPFTVVADPAINALVYSLVEQRCSIDVVPTRQARHCSAIFSEKSGYHFKTTIMRSQSRQLQFEERDESLRI